MTTPAVLTRLSTKAIQGSRHVGFPGSREEPCTPSVTMFERRPVAGENAPFFPPQFHLYAEGCWVPSQGTDLVFPVGLPPSSSLPASLPQWSSTRHSARPTSSGPGSLTKESDEQAGALLAVTALRFCRSHPRITEPAPGWVRRRRKARRAAELLPLPCKRPPLDTVSLSPRCPIC